MTEIKLLFVPLGTEIESNSVKIIRLIPSDEGYLLPKQIQIEGKKVCMSKIKRRIKSIPVLFEARIQKQYLPNVSPFLMSVSNFIYGIDEIEEYLSALEFYEEFL